MKYAEKLTQYLGKEGQLTGGDYVYLQFGIRLDDRVPKGTIKEIGDDFVVVDGQLGDRKWETIISLNRFEVRTNKQAG